MQDFKKLDVWNEAMSLCQSIFKLIERIPNAELNAQLGRSAISIPSNIAEGCGKTSSKAMYNHLNIAYASACELQTQILLAGYLVEANVSGEDAQSVRVQKMLYSLMRSIKQQHLKKY